MIVLDASAAVDWLLQTSAGQILAKSHSVDLMLQISLGHNSQQAFISIQTIHLMNFDKSDTLAPLNKNVRRP
jgi:hypothetical protein